MKFIFRRCFFIFRKTLKDFGGNKLILLTRLPLDEIFLVHGFWLQTMLQDAKQLFSNREVIRQINQFLDELITGDDTQTPPTPSDSSLTSLAQLAQVGETILRKLRPLVNVKVVADGSSFL